jgi:hypothetical protein
VFRLPAVQTTAHHSSTKFAFGIWVPVKLFWTERKGEIVSLLVCFVALVLALTAYYFPLLVEGREYFVSDHTYFFEPFARLIREAWLAQRPPLWNPYIYCGSPQLANPSPGMFYFPNFLFVAFSYSTALALIQFFHQLVAFAGSYLFSRMLRFSVASASFVGLTIALSGYFFSLPANYTLPATFAWGVRSAVQPSFSGAETQLASLCGFVYFGSALDAYGWTPRNLCAFFCYVRLS